MKIKQAGFTLVELMIGLLLSTILIAAIGKVFIDSGNSFRKQKTLSYLVEDGRFVLDILAKEFRRAGFLRNRYASDGTPEAIFLLDNGTGGGVLNSSIQLERREYIHGDFSSGGFVDNSGSTNPFDINHVVLRYQLNDAKELSATNPNYGLSPCSRGIDLKSGEDPATQKIWVTLFLYVEFDSNLKTPVLKCKAKRDNLNLSTKVTSGAIDLVSNVERMYILYGVLDESINCTQRYPSYTAAPLSAVRYLSANQVVDKLTVANTDCSSVFSATTTPTPLSPWELVVSVRLYIVLGSKDKNVTLKTPGYNLDGRTYSVNSPNDKRLYRVFTTTIALRNN